MTTFTPEQIEAAARAMEESDHEPGQNRLPWQDYEHMARAALATLTLPADPEPSNIANRWAEATRQLIALRMSRPPVDDIAALSRLFNRHAAQIEDNAAHRINEWLKHQIADSHGEATSEADPPELISARERLEAAALTAQAKALEKIAQELVTSNGVRRT